MICETHDLADLLLRSGTVHALINGAAVHSHKPVSASGSAYQCHNASLVTNVEHTEQKRVFGATARLLHNTTRTLRALWSNGYRMLSRAVLCCTVQRGRLACPVRRKLALAFAVQITNR